MDKVFWLFVAIIGTVRYASGTYHGNARAARSASLSVIDSNVRPSDLMEVCVGFNLLTITDIDSDENRMSLVGWFTVTWNDTNLTWDPNQVSFANVTSVHYKEGEIWRPELRVENSVKEVDVIANEHHRFRVLENGTVTWQPAKYMEVYCAQDLTYYPFDKQKCHVILTSWSHDVSEVTLKLLRTTVDLTFYEENADWILDEEIVAALSNKTSTSGGETITNSRITFYFTMSRVSNLVGLTFLFPLILLSALSIFVFLLPVESGEKVNYCSLILLSIVVFFTFTVSYFPVSKVVPIRVTYVLVVFVLSCMSVLCTLLVLWLHHQRPDRHMGPDTVKFSSFLSVITCNRENMERIQDTKTIENIPETSNSVDHPKQLTPIQNGGSHLTATMDKLPPVNDHLRKNRVRPKSGESIYSLSKRRGRQGSGQNNWQQLARSFDRLCFVLFLVMSFLMHFIFLVTLAAGGQTSDP